jgi:hypothetical protein
MNDCPLKNVHYQNAIEFVRDTPYDELIGKAPEYSFEAGLAAMRAIGMGGDVKIILKRLKAGSFNDVTLDEALGRDV